MRNTTDIHIRIPEDLHRRLREQAEQDARSLNNLIVYLLRKALEETAR